MIDIEDPVLRRRLYAEARLDGKKRGWLYKDKVSPAVVPPAKYFRDPGKTSVARGPSLPSRGGLRRLPQE